jgi:uncharacterized protein YjiS (DUF1127 family)
MQFEILAQGVALAPTGASSAEAARGILFKPADDSESLVSLPETAAWRDPIAAAASWFMAQVIAGFAAYGESICPGPCDLGQAFAREVPVEKPRRRRPATRSRSARLPFRDGRPARPVLGRIARVRARFKATLVIVWSRARRQLEIRNSVVELGALDDRMLRDIGIWREQIKHSAGSCRDRE